MKDNIQARIIVTKPSFMLSDGTFLTKMKGKAPTIKVMTKLTINGPKPESLPYRRDTPIDSAMNKALTRRAFPTFTDMALMSITLRPPHLPMT